MLKRIFNALLSTHILITIDSYSSFIVKPGPAALHAFKGNGRALAHINSVDNGQGMSPINDVLLPPSMTRKHLLLSLIAVVFESSPACAKGGGGGASSSSSSGSSSGRSSGSSRSRSRYGGERRSYSAGYRAGQQDKLVGDTVNSPATSTHADFVFIGGCCCFAIASFLTGEKDSAKNKAGPLYQNEDDGAYIDGVFDTKMAEDIPGGSLQPPASGFYSGSSAESDGAEQAVFCELQFAPDGTLRGKGDDSDDGVYTIEGCWSNNYVKWKETYANGPNGRFVTTVRGLFKSEEKTLDCRFVSNKGVRGNFLLGFFL